MINFLLTLIVLVVLVAGVLYYFRKREDADEEAPVYTFESMDEFVGNYMHEEAYSEPDSGLSNADYLSFLDMQSVLKQSLGECAQGNVGAKRYVKSVMKRGLIKAYDLTEENCDQLIPFSRPDTLSVTDKWDILMFHFSRVKGREGFSTMSKKYNFATLKKYDRDFSGYGIAEEDVIDAFDQEDVQLTLNDKIDIITQRLYQRRWGLSVIDELRDQNIDGVNGGTSGLPSDVAAALDYNDPGLLDLRNAPRAYDAVWILFKGKSVNLPFLSFGSDLELQRVCQNIYTFGNAVSQLNESSPYKVNDMADGSRVVVLRPKMAESWAFFVRKFDVSNIELEKLIRDENCELMIDAIKYLMKGLRTTLFTGQQGTGKTTLMSASFKYLYGYYNMRIQEMAFELRLRKLMPHRRNILSMRATSTVTGQEIINISKKTDSAISIVGEIADAETASMATQNGLVASMATYASHHGKTAEEAAIAIAMNLKQTGQVGSIEEGLELVLQVWKFNLNLVKNVEGHRYPDRLTEYIRLPKYVPYDRSFLNAETKAEREIGKMNADIEYYERLTDRKVFDVQNVIYWENGTFKPGPMFTDENIQEMWKTFLIEDKQSFKAYLKQWWPFEYAKRGYEQSLRIVLSEDELAAQKGIGA